MGYNVLSGSTSVTHQISVSGSFIGDGALLENVEQFPLQNAVVTRIKSTGMDVIGAISGSTIETGLLFSDSGDLTIQNEASDKDIIFLSM